MFFDKEPAVYVGGFMPSSPLPPPLEAVANFELLSRPAGPHNSEAAELVAGITHDFNNILHVIHAHTALILSQPTASSNVRRHAETIRDTVEEGIVLVRRLLDDPKAEPRMESCDINKLLQRAIKSLAPVFPLDIALNLDLDPQTPLIRLDAGLVYQAMLNLCVNAREAMPEGGTIRVQSCTTSGAALRQWFPQAGAERYVAITVADTGLGMETAVKERVFELHFTSKKAGPGSGLGLSIVQAAANRHGGFVGVTSKPGCGSTFHLYFPVSKEEATGCEIAPSTPPKKIEDRTRHGETVLYAEDDDRLLCLMQRLLERGGLKVLTARDGIQALDVYSRHSSEIMVAVLDSRLPNLDGWEAFRRMRQIDPKLKGILASGFVSAETESHVAKGELSGVLQKPYFGAELLAMINQVIKSS